MEQLRAAWRCCAQARTVQLAGHGEEGGLGEEVLSVVHLQTTKCAGVVSIGKCSPIGLANKSVCSPMVAMDPDQAKCTASGPLEYIAPEPMLDISFSKWHKSRPGRVPPVQPARHPSRALQHTPCPPRS